MIKVITFDLWNTLLSEGNYVNLRFSYLLSVLGKENIFRFKNDMHKAYISIYDYVHKVWESENYRHVPAEERVNLLLKKLNVVLSEEVKLNIIQKFKEAILKNPPILIPGVEETLDKQ